MWLCLVEWLGFVVECEYNVFEIDVYEELDKCLCSNM